MILIKSFLDICLLRAGPAELPTSVWFSKICLLLYFAVGILICSVDHSWGISMAVSLADTLLLMLICWLALTLRRHSERYLQTVTAMAGAGTLIGLVNLPVILIFRSVEHHGQLTSLILLLVVVLILWSLAVTAHIFRQALDIGAGMAAAVTIAYAVLSLILVESVIAGVG